MISKYVINNSFFSVGKASLKGGGKRGKIGVIPSVRTAQRKTFTFVEQSPWNNPGIFAHFFALSRPRISVYKRGRDATCCVRKKEDEIAGKARKDTDSEGFADNIQIGAREVM